MQKFIMLKLILESAPAKEKLKALLSYYIYWLLVEVSCEQSASGDKLQWACSWGNNSMLAGKLGWQYMELFQPKYSTSWKN